MGGVKLLFGSSLMSREGMTLDNVGCSFTAMMETRNVEGDVSYSGSRVLYLGILSSVGKVVAVGNAGR